MKIALETVTITSSFRYEMIDILRTNNFNTSQVSSYDKTITNKRAKHTERRILKGFNISTVDTLQAAFAEKENNSSKDFFKVKCKHKLSNLSRMPNNGYQ